MTLLDVLLEAAVPVILLTIMFWGGTHLADRIKDWWNDKTNGTGGLT